MFADGVVPTALLVSTIAALPVSFPPDVSSADLYSPPPVKKSFCFPAGAGGTRPLVPVVDAVAPSYSGTETMPLLTAIPSPMRSLKIPSDQGDQIFSLSFDLYATRIATEVDVAVAKAIWLTNLLFLPLKTISLAENPGPFTVPARLTA